MRLPEPPSFIRRTPDWAVRDPVDVHEELLRAVHSTYGSEEEVDEALAAGADPQTRLTAPFEHAWDALSLALTRDYPHAIEALLRAGADPLQRPAFERSSDYDALPWATHALAWAAERNLPAAAQMLDRAGGLAALLDARGAEAVAPAAVCTGLLGSAALTGDIGLFQEALAVAKTLPVAEQTALRQWVWLRLLQDVHSDHWAVSDTGFARLGKRLYAAFPPLTRSELSAKDYAQWQIELVRSAPEWLLEREARQWQVEDFTRPHKTIDGMTAVLHQVLRPLPQGHDSSMEGWAQPPGEGALGFVLDWLAEQPGGPAALREVAFNAQSALPLAFQFAEFGSLLLWRALYQACEVSGQAAATWTDAYGRTALHAVASARIYPVSRQALAQHLVARGADLDACDAHGYTPLAIACGNRLGALLLPMKDDDETPRFLVTLFQSLGAQWEVEGADPSVQPLYLLQELHPSLWQQEEPAISRQVAQMRAHRLQQGLPKGPASARRRM